MDETESGGGGGAGGVDAEEGISEADGILSPLGKMGLVTPEKQGGKGKAKRKGRPGKEASQVQYTPLQETKLKKRLWATSVLKTSRCAVPFKRQLGAACGNANR